MIISLQKMIVFMKCKLLRNGFILIFLLAFISCNVNNVHDVVYESSKFRVVLKVGHEKIDKIELMNRFTQTKISYSNPELLVWDDGIPIEGGLIADYNTLLDRDIFSCDSIYEIETDSINMVFGLERITNQRLDLSIIKSMLINCPVGDCTLNRMICDNMDSCSQ